MKKVVSLSIAISDTSISTAFVECFSRVPRARTKRTMITSYRFKKINPRLEDISAEYIESRMMTLLKEVLHDTRYVDMERSGYKVSHIQKIVVSLSAPWFDSKVIRSHFAEVKPFKVTKDHIRKVFESEIKMVSGKDTEYISVLESAVLNTTLNGYTIQDPIGKVASTLTVNGYVHYIKTSLKKSVYGAIESFFPHRDEIRMTSEPSILLLSLFKKLGTQSDTAEFVLVRMNEILTHIQIIAGGHIRTVGTIPIGLNHILTSIEKTCHVTREVAESVLGLYSEHQLESALSANIKQSIEASFVAWKNAVKEFSLSTISSGKFPSCVYLSSPKSISNTLREYLISDNYLDITLSESKLSIIILDQHISDSFIEIGKTVEKHPGLITQLNAMIY